LLIIERLANPAFELTGAFETGLGIIDNDWQRGWWFAGIQAVHRHFTGRTQASGASILPV
jgi:hypothetical protein